MATRAPAPVVLFVFNRPLHTRRTLEALSASAGAAETELHVYCDGAKPEATEAQLAAIREVREIVAERPWCGRVVIHASETNRGLAASIVGGVGEVVRMHGRVIVLEDDIEVTSGFLRYMNEALDLYENEEKVYQVSAFMVPMRFAWRSTGMLRVTTSWGWGTWARAWEHYRDDSAGLLAEIGSAGKHRFDLDGTSFHYEELERNVRGELRTWAVKWYASVFLKDGLCVYPRRPLVLNAGFDGTGTNCHDDKSGTSVSPQTAASIRVRRVPLEEDAGYLAAMRNYYRIRLLTWTNRRLRDRVRSKFKRIVGKFHRPAL